MERKTTWAILHIVVCTFVVLLLSSTQARAGDWRTLADGLDIGTFTANHATPVGDSTITILRIDPTRWDLRILNETEYRDASSHTAREWCDELGLVAAINAGMFHQDGTTHVGFMRSAEHVNNNTWNDYKSVAAFGPKRSDVPAFRMFDLDAVPKDSILARYEHVIQNLRLIKRPGQNRWSQQEKRWSEAALGEDRDGNVLFIFCRSPYSMHDLNQILLDLPINLVAAQHLEGGPEAQLTVHTAELELELVGSFETDFREDDGNHHAWRIPNIIGVSPKRPADH